MKAHSFSREIDHRFSAILVVSLFVTLFPRSARMDDSCSTESCQVFPKDFYFGTATASYQIEGGWNEDGKGLNIWDTLLHEKPDLVLDKSNGDVGPDSYHLYKEDVKRLKELGVNFYRFSVSWSRILPTGDVSSLNPAGVKYYSDLIDLLLQEGIQPMVTMFHYDLPQYVQDLGGVTNPLFVKYFREYARVLFDNFADRVKLWSTFNEPCSFAYYGHGLGEIAPMKKLHGVGEYYAAYHILLAHAEVYHLFKEQYHPKHKGKIGLTLSSMGMFQKSPGDDLVERGLQFTLGFFAHPIFSRDGGWPKVIQETVDRNSKAEGRAWSRLPVFTPEQIERVKGSADFFGLNYFTGRFVELGSITDGKSYPDPSWERDQNLTFSTDPSWKRGKSEWLYLAPEGLRGILKWIKKTYDNPEVIITESGWSDGGELEDEARVECLRAHLKVVLEALQAGCRVKAFSVWSLIDNFEWMMGYSEKFGLYRVDVDDPEKKRVAKKSARIYKEIIKNRQIV
ncbi:myrosinase 1-like [Phlebotomus argentipes]|uniref:myrosinase 1-like n=1 Tax=Phlebotomus argentipes TaxID=94469 RepID=UPI0028937424|nr:myrosinase 1-like [Phlebotomus argentipes]